MKENKPKYLKLYKKWMKDQRLPHGRGLCYELANLYDKHGEALLDLLSPTSDDDDSLRDNWLETRHWGSDAPDKQLGVFTPLRQNLVLLMAALNNEL